MYRIPSTLDGDIDYTESLIRKYKAGEISASQLKSNRVPMGIYEQRKDGHHMLRIRCTGGLITPRQLKRVAEVGRKVSCSHIHLTTRQELQIHNVDILDATAALKDLERVGLATQGGGGNTVRNIMVDEFSGISSRQAFDVYPDAVELTSRLIAEKDSFTMPRKLKTAFDISTVDADYSLINDFGLQARLVNGKRGFRALLGGSCASNPHLGWEVFDFLPERDLLRALKAAKNFFNKYGNRKNRHKARIRYIFYKRGVEETVRLYLEEFSALKGDDSLDLIPAALPFEYLTPATAPLSDFSDDFLTWKRRYARRQSLSPRGAGEPLWTTVIPFAHGNTCPDQLEEIADFLSAFGNDVVRLTPTESMRLRNVPEEYLPNIYRFFLSEGLKVERPALISRLTSCTGADTCRLGVCLPKGAVRAIGESLMKSGLNLDLIPSFRLKINGCTNGCAQNTWADLGFSGRIGRVGDDPYPAYTVYLRVNGHKTIAVPQGFVGAKNLPPLVVDYLRDVIDALRGEEALQSDEWYDFYDGYVSERGRKTILSLIAKYGKAPSYSEAPRYYYDWGSDDKFSLTSHGQAECSAGLFDIIDIDRDNIHDKLKALAKEGADRERLLADIVFSEARMLLVTRGIDPRTDDEVYDGFIEKFIDEGIVPGKYRSLIEKRRKALPLEGDKDLAVSLAHLLDALYEGMDDSLQFKTPAGEPSKERTGGERGKEEEKKKATVKKDFRGVACPMNFVKTKIALSALKTGDVLEILLDDGEPIRNVPGSVRLEGHQVLSTEKEGDHWRVTIRKK